MGTIPCRECGVRFTPEDEGWDLCDGCLDKRLKAQAALILPPRKPRIGVLAWVRHEFRTLGRWLFSTKGGR